MKMNNGYNTKIINKNYVITSIKIIIPINKNFHPLFQPKYHSHYQIHQIILLLF